MLVEESGPGRYFYKLRYKLKDNSFSPLDCFYCTSIWVGFIISLFIGNIIINTFLISGISMFIYHIFERTSNG